MPATLETLDLPTWGFWCGINMEAWVGGGNFVLLRCPTPPPRYTTTTWSPGKGICMDQEAVIRPTYRFKDFAHRSVHLKTSAIHHRITKRMRTNKISTYQRGIRTKEKNVERPADLATGDGAPACSHATEMVHSKTAAVVGEDQRQM